MCLGPEIIIPALLAGAGTFATGMGQKKINRKQQQIYDQYSAKNRQRQDQAMAEVMSGVNQYGANQTQAALADSQSERAGAITDRTAPGSENDYTGSAPSAVRRDIGRRIVETVAEGRERSAISDRLGSYGDWLGANQRNNMGIADTVSMLGNFSRGDADVAGAKMEAAKSAGDTWFTIADLLKLAGTASNLYMATGAGGFPSPAGIGKVSRHSVLPGAGTPIYAGGIPA